MTLYITMVVFALTTAITPGPVNIITVSSGLNYGFKNTMPFVFGASSGFTLIFLIVSLSLSQLGLQNPSYLLFIGIAGAVFLAYIGFKISTAKPQIKVDNSARPKFIKGAVLQWLNPKSYIATLAAITAFGIIGQTKNILIFAGIYFIICLFSISTWAFIGAQLSHFITSQSHIIIFNRITGGLLIILSVYLIFSLAMGH